MKLASDPGGFPPTQFMIRPEFSPPTLVGCAGIAPPRPPPPPQLPVDTVCSIRALAPERQNLPVPRDRPNNPQTTPGTKPPPRPPLAAVRNTRGSTCLQ